MKRYFYITVGIMFMIAGCYPGGPDYYEETDIVYTNYDEDFNFTENGTFAIPDKIVRITGDLLEEEPPEFVKEPYNTQMLEKMISNMTARGFTLTEDPANADVVLLPAVWTNTTIYYWYDYWCWYYYPYYCGWGWGYPAVTSYTTGTLVMTLMSDGEEFAQPTDVWTSAINGLVSGSYNASRVTKGIDQAFEQSPYLNIN